MLESQIVLDPSVQRLVEAGYPVSIEGDFLIVDNVPYVAAAGVVGRGALISAYRQVDGMGQVGGDHALWFTGSVPCMADGSSLENALVADTMQQVIAGRQVQCRLSNKPDPIGEMLDNFYNKMTHYIRKLTAHADAVEPGVSASGTGSFHYKQERSVFFYPNASVAQAGLDAYEAKLRIRKVAIVGVGGTGSYILDALAKTPVEQIHLFDDDVIEPKNAFRMPAALTIEQAHGDLRKVDFLEGVYRVMRTGIQGHPVRIDVANADLLDDCNFVFIAVDDGPSRGLIAQYLVERGIPFIDVGMGVDKVPETTELIARARVTLVTPETRHLASNLPTADDRDEAVYNNIQLVELNALNAMLAVVRYKQYLGFYADEYHPSTVKYISSWSRLIPQPERA